MKKKFINGLLMGALFVGFTSSMVSCKDYDDEKITNLEGILSDNVDALKKALDSQKADLERQIKVVKDAQDSCSKACAAFQTKIYNDLKLYVKQEDFIKTLTDSLGNYYTKQEVDGKVTYVLQYTDTQVAGLRKDLLDSLDLYLRKSALAQSAADLLNQGGNVMTTALDNYIANYNKLNDIIDSTEIRKMLQAEVIKLNFAIDQARATAEAAKGLAERDSVRIDALDGLVAGLQGDVKTLQGDVKDLKGDVKDIKDDLDIVRTTANNAWAKAQANETLIGNLRTDLGKLDEKVDNNYTELKGLIGKNKTSIDSLGKVVEDNKAEADSIHKEVTKKFEQLDFDLGQLTTRVKGLEERMDDAEEAIFGLAMFVNEITYKTINSIEINGTYNPMYGELALPLNIRSNMLVVFNGITDDRGLQFPSRNQDYAALPDQWMEGNFTDADLEMLGVQRPNQLKGFVRIGENEEFVANQQFDASGNATDVTEGNAGTIYMTINPTNRDFTGTEFTLINSANKEVPVELSTLKKSDHVLTFGYTRAGVDPESQSPNGFYETQVTVQPENVKELGINFNLDAVKDVAKDIKDYKNGISLTTLVNAVYDNINNLIDANAMKTTWTIGEGEDAEEFSAVSQYALGVASIKPLSFSFAKDITFDGIPGTNLAQDFLDNMLGALRENLGVFDKYLERFDVEKLELLEVNGELTSTVEAKIRFYLGDRHIVSSGPKSAVFTFPFFTITGIHGEKVTIKNTNPNVEVYISGNDSYIDVQLDISDFIRYMGKYDTEPVPNIRKQFQDLLDDVNKLIGEIKGLNFSSISDKLSTKLTDFIQELNSHFSRFEHPNRFFKPILVVTGDKGMVRLSTSAITPTKAKGALTYIIPTNYNAETVSPAFKKFMAVTDVINNETGASAKGKNGQCKSILDEMNKAKGFNEVIDGGFQPFPFAPKSGYTYEIIYSAVDYSAKIVTKKFYIKVQ